MGTRRPALRQPSGTMRNQDWSLSPLPAPLALGRRVQQPADPCAGGCRARGVSVLSPLTFPRATGHGLGTPGGHHVPTHPQHHLYPFRQPLQGLQRPPTPGSRLQTPGQRSLPEGEPPASAPHCTRLPPQQSPPHSGAHPTRCPPHSGAHPTATAAFRVPALLAPEAQDKARAPEGRPSPGPAWGLVHTLLTTCSAR